MLFRLKECGQMVVKKQKEVMANVVDLPPWTCI